MSLTVQNVAIDSVSPHPQNVRQGDVGAIVQSLESHGQYRPIVVQASTGFILAGNHTWKAAKTLGWSNIDVTEIDVDDEQALRIMLVDNKSNDLATYDDAALAELLASLAATETSLEGTGFTIEGLDELINELNTPLTFDDEPKPTNDEDRSKLLDIADLAYGEPKHETQDGDVWCLSGRHYLAVVEPHTGWSLFTPFLKDGSLLCVYPDIYITASDAGESSSFVLVQPIPYLAGHLLDKHAAFFGETSVERVSP
jgi:hypothetical protein